MHRLKRWVLACALVPLVTLPATALAQLPGVVTVNPVPTKREPDPIGHDTRTAISYADCRANTVLTFAVSMQNVSGGELQVWVSGPGAACELREQRVNDDRQCWLIHTLIAINQNGLPVPLRAQDIISNDTSSSNKVTGTAQTCDESDFGSTGPQKLTLHFLVIDSSGTSIATPATVTIDADLLGPPAPTAIKAGVGEERVVLSWTAQPVRDREGHRFYCDPKPGPLPTTMQADGGIGPDSGADASVDGPGGADGGGNEAGPTGGVGGAGGAGGAGGSSDASATDGAATDGGGNAACPSTALVRGERPSNDFLCGSAGPTTNEGEATGLVNYQLYAVGIAAIDNFGNSGPLSEIVCGTPQEVDDFYEVYKRAGGVGGGGFCSLGAQPAYGAGLMLGVAALARWARRRRRR